MAGPLIEEIGDAMRAEVVRLVGDGLLLLQSLSGPPPDASSLDALAPERRGSPPPAPSGGWG